MSISFARAATPDPTEIYHNSTRFTILAGHFGASEATARRHPRRRPLDLKPLCFAGKTHQALDCIGLRKPTFQEIVNPRQPLFLFGFLTQVAIALAHAGTSRAILASVMLFSVAFSGSIFVLFEFDDPYQMGQLFSIKPFTDVE